MQIWEPAYTLLHRQEARHPHRSTSASRRPGRRSPAAARIPYLGVGAHADWADQNPALVAKLYATYKAAAEWIAEESRRGARRWWRRGATADDVKAMAALIRANERLGHEPCVGASEIRKEIEAVYKAGIDVGYFPPHAVGRDSVYDKPVR